MEAVMAKDNLVNQPSVEAAPRKGSRQYCELVTRKIGGDPFIRKIMVNGRPYWQRCKWIYVDGVRKLKIIEHLGTRKPREKGGRAGHARKTVEKWAG